MAREVDFFYESKSENWSSEPRTGTGIPWNWIEKQFWLKSIHFTAPFQTNVHKRGTEDCQLAPGLLTLTFGWVWCMNRGVKSRCGPRSCRTKRGPSTKDVKFLRKNLQSFWPFSGENWYFSRQNSDDLFRHLPQNRKMYTFLLWNR